MEAFKWLLAETAVLRQGEVVGCDERFVPAKQKSRSFESIRSRLAGEHDDGRAPAVLRLKAGPERAEFLNAIEAQLHQCPAVLIFLVVHTIDIHVVAAAGVARKRDVAGGITV